MNPSRIDLVLDRDCDWRMIVPIGTNKQSLSIKAIPAAMRSYLLLRLKPALSTTNGVNRNDDGTISKAANSTYKSRRFSYLSPGSITR
jgi:hypothetical protein